MIDYQPFVGRFGKLAWSERSPRFTQVLQALQNAIVPPEPDYPADDSAPENSTFFSEVLTKGMPRRCELSSRKRPV